MLAVLEALGQIALELGLTRVIDAIDRSKTMKLGIDSSQVTKTIGTMIQEARNRGSNILNKLLDKLSSVNYPYSMSDNVQTYLQNIKRNMSNEYDKVRRQVANVETKLNVAEDNLNLYSNLPASTQHIAYRNLPDKIKDDVTEQAKKISEIEVGLK